MLSRRFYRHLMIVSNDELAAEIRITIDPEALAALVDAQRQRRDIHEAIEQATPGHRWPEVHPQHVETDDDTPTTNWK